MRATLITASTLALLFAGTLAAEETPPPGPPWKTSFSDAQREGLKKGRPLFLYFTKTH